MTHPLTPREKVELKPCPFCGGSPEMEFSEFELHDGFHVVCVGDKNCPLYCSEPYRAQDTEKEAAEVWNRRTALASVSGDHAGLRRLADEAADFGVPAQVDPAVLNALLAENAALRAANTEAERKLAEALGLLGDVVFVRKDNAGQSAEYMLSEVITKARTFLSKEAERG